MLTNTTVFQVEEGSLAPKDVEDFAAAFPSGTMTPSALECLCAECDTLGEMVGRVRETFQ